MAKSSNPLLRPFFTRGLSQPVCGDLINRKVKMNPDTVKNTGAVIPLKYFHVLNRKLELSRKALSSNPSIK